ncbi:hypothetical protein POM88_051245 [Heracleum sosnowskyi]|uniref:Uncharacterized protein n=1 Tax=Heracleum sosnowskyi TaxID=360622 RepID=A0AAD8H1E6_9APIA|nr:hypothetical protein POM88_051245 [Heracleum sosnowskyi]
MRCTVVPGEFLLDRSFVFVDFEVLASSTESTDCVGMLRLSGKKKTPVDVFTNKDWLKMSGCGEGSTYGGAVVQPGGHYNPEQNVEIAFRDRVRGFEESKRAAAQKV